MFQILTFFWRLCLLKEVPSKIPNSIFAALITFGIYLIIAFTILLNTRPEQSVLKIFSSSVIGITIQLSLTYLLLKFKNREYTYIPAVCSLLGTNAIMLLLLFPLNLTLLYAQNSNLLVIANSFSLVCLGWWLAIAGFIYHKSADVSMVQGTCLALLIEIMSVLTATKFSIS
tara:strand:+ start:2093 stop:2608 length:516 start_codon:yes stop_codon:yes gene_type:complete